MTPQQLTSKASAATDAFANLHGAHSTLVRELSAALVESHGLTVNDYGCLLLLSRAGDEGMRRIDLANEINLSPSGITRLLDRLEAQGLVGKGACKEDARVSYAILTEAGKAKLEAARPGHIEDIANKFTATLSEEEIQTLAELLGRLSDHRDDEVCAEATDPGPGAAANG